MKTKSGKVSKANLGYNIHMNPSLPKDYKFLFWSEDFETLDPQKDMKKIIVNIVNYGELEHWRWISKCYGRESVAAVLSTIPATELRDRVRPLAKIIFEVPSFNYALRNVKTGS